MYLAEDPRLLVSGNDAAAGSVRQFPTSGIKARRASAKGGNLKQATGDRNVPEEMDDLIGIGEVAVECDRGGATFWSLRRFSYASFTQGRGGGGLVSP